MKLSKHAAFWPIAARNLLRYRGRTIAVLIPLLATMACLSALTFLKDGTLAEALTALSALPDVTVQRREGGRDGSTGEEILGEISRYQNVRTAQPRIWGRAEVEGEAPGEAILAGVGADLLARLSESGFSLRSGRFLRDDDRGRALVGRLYAERRGIAPGDHIDLVNESGQRVAFTVAGVFDHRARLYAGGLILTDLETARAFFNYDPGRYTDVGVYLDDPLRADQAALRISAAREGVRAFTRADLADAARREYGSRAGTSQLLWLMLLVSAGLTAWAQGSSVSLEMRKEIGVLKAIGWRTLDVIEIKMMETAMIGLIGILGGGLLAIAYLRLGAPLLSSYFLDGAGAAVPFLPIRIGWSGVFLLLLLGLAPLSAATVIPAWRTGTIDPDRAIRNG